MSSRALVAARGTRSDLRLREALFRAALYASVAVGVIALITLIVQVLVKGWPELNWGIVSNFPSSLPSKAGAQSAIFGTVWIIGIVAVTTLPLGVGAAI